MKEKKGEFTSLNLRITEKLQQIMNIEIIQNNNFKEYLKAKEYFLFQVVENFQDNLQSKKKIRRTEEFRKS